MSNAQHFILRRWPWLLASLLLTVTLFICSAIGWFWYVDQRTASSRQFSLDVLWLEQMIINTLAANQRILINWGHDLRPNIASSHQDFIARSEGLMKQNSALIAIDYLDKQGDRRMGVPIYTERPERLPPINDPLISEAILRSRSLKTPSYSRVIEQYAPLWVLAIPLQDEDDNEGVVLVTYDLDQLLAQEVPWWFVKRYDLSLIDRSNKQLSPRDTEVPVNAEDIYKLAFGPPDSGLSLRASPHRNERSGYLLPLLSIAVFVFGLMIVWLLQLLQRWLRERLAAQQALAKELRFRDAMEHSLVTGLIAYDHRGLIIYVNPALCEMLGRTSQVLLGTRAPFAFWPVEYHAECAEAHGAMLRGENPVQGRLLNLLGAGNAPLWVRLFASPLVDGQHGPSGWMVSLYDNTELQREREALASSREQLYTILASLEAAVSVSSLDDGHLLFRNRHHQSLIQIDADAECCLLPWPNTSPGMLVKSAEFEMPDSKRWYHLERRCISWVDSSQVILDITTDITAERQTANAARERDELLQHTARLSNLAEFASGIAHELNQPLAAITNYSAAADSFMQNDPPHLPKAQQAIRRMGEESRRAGEIIRSLRNFIQKRPILHETRKLYSLLTEPLALLDPLAQRLNISITVNVEVSEQSVLVDCDAVMIEQVLLNLMRNALESVAAGQILIAHDAVQVSIVRELASQSVIVSVRDRGIGLKEPEKLFQAFYTTKTDGMGLGLAICRTVVESHGGRLWAEANFDGGACFHFRLPCYQADHQLVS